MRTHAPSEAPVTLQEIEEAMVYVAYLVEKYGDAYAPVLDRLEREFEAARRKEQPRDKARRILEQHTTQTRRQEVAGT